MGFDRVDLAGAVRTICERLDARARTFVITANPEFVMLARRDAELCGIARDAELVIPDGTGIVAAARLLGDRLPGRAPGRFLVDALVPRLAERGLSVYLLGAAPGIAERAGQELRRRAPLLRVAGTHSGSASDDGAAALVARSGADVLLVAYGMPSQERWISRNLALLPSVRLAIGVGGVFDQLSGRTAVPPRMVHAIGLEWLWRLVREPRRWRRQRVLPLFALLVLAERARKLA
ncbi:MAG: WecB/TagA/CpsF family glycosyltransferase [Chloroflexi bacterium]|nr:WecB/TagA/CpsF family glycosyltransferase [Chloroflexota bacterium]